MTVSLWDDDTGQPVRMDGTQLAGAAPFTSAAWTVKSGSIVTTSTTGIVIPVYPFSNDLSALALVVPPGLNLVQGAPITIVDTATGLNSMTGYVVSYAQATGFLVVQVGWTFQFEIRRCDPRSNFGGYVPWYDWGAPGEHGALLSASLGNGIYFIDIGVIQILIPANQFRKLHNGTYLVGMTATDSVNTRQMMLGQLPVQFGGVTGPQPAMAGAAGGAFSGGFSGGFS